MKTRVQIDKEDRMFLSLLDLFNTCLEPVLIINALEQSKLSGRELENLGNAVGKVGHNKSKLGR